MRRVGQKCVVDADRDHHTAREPKWTFGKALLGHRRNDQVEVAVPRGPKRKLKITKIEPVAKK